MKTIRSYESMERWFTPWGVSLHALAVAAIALLWCVTPACAHGLRSMLAETPTVNQDSILISLPVYIVSLIATAGATWAIAKYDSQRIAEVRALRQEVDQMRQEQGRPPKGG